MLLNIYNILLSSLVRFSDLKVCEQDLKDWRLTIFLHCSRTSAFRINSSSVFGNTQIFFKSPPCSRMVCPNNCTIPWQRAENNWFWTFSSFKMEDASVLFPSTTLAAFSCILLYIWRRQSFLDHRFSRFKFQHNTEILRIPISNGTHSNNRAYRRFYFDF